MTRRPTISKRHLLLVLPICLLHACGTLEYPHRANIRPVDDSHPTALNGRYLNMPVPDSNNVNHTLWSTLVTKKHFYALDTVLRTDSQQIEFSQLSPCKLEARLYDRNSLVAKTILRGRYLGSYFSVKRRMRYFGLPFLYIKYTKYKFHVGRNEDGTLIIDGINSRFAWVVVFTGGANDQFIATYPDVLNGRSER